MFTVNSPAFVVLLVASTITLITSVAPVSVARAASTEPSAVKTTVAFAAKLFNFNLVVVPKIGVPLIS